MTTGIDPAAARADFESFQRRLRTQAQIERFARRPMSVRRFYLLNTGLVDANPWQAPPRWFGQYAGSRPAPKPRSVAHGGVAA